MVRSSSRERESRSRETRLSSRDSSRDLQGRGAESRSEGAGASANRGGWGLLDPGGSEAANTETREVRGPLRRSGDNYSTRVRESETQKGQSVLGACSPPPLGRWWMVADAHLFTASSRSERAPIKTSSASSCARSSFCLCSSSRRDRSSSPCSAICGQGKVQKGR